jgi:hypothetical protein
MNFIRLIDEAADRVEVNVLQGGIDSIARVCLGYDPESGRIYSASVALVIVPGQPDDHRELVFDVVDAHPEDDRDIEFLNDGLQTKSFLAGEDRLYALRIICLAACHLIDSLRPNVISMMTVERDLPDKALRKYHVLADAISSLGYQAGEADPYYGTRIWLLRRIAEET